MKIWKKKKRKIFLINMHLDFFALIELCPLLFVVFFLTLASIVLNNSSKKVEN